jgi:hypothetical protein
MKKVWKPVTRRGGRRKETAEERAQIKADLLHILLVMKAQREAKRLLKLETRA